MNGAGQRYLFELHYLSPAVPSSRVMPADLRTKISTGMSELQSFVAELTYEPSRLRCLQICIAYRCPGLFAFVKAELLSLRYVSTYLDE